MPLNLDHRAVQGGAIALEAAGDEEPELRLSSTLVQGNRASMAGGGLDLNCGITHLGSRTNITGNTANLGGGVALDCSKAALGSTSQDNVTHLYVDADARGGRADISNNTAVSVISG